MRIITKTYFNDYQNQLGFDLESVFNSMDFDNKKVDLGYRIQASAVFSSNIEGNSIDLNSYMNIKLSNQIFKPKKEVQEIEDLVTAYEFAKANELNEKNLLKIHQILSQTLLPEYRQGAYRNDKMGVFDENGLVYLAIEPQFVGEKMKELFADIDTLLQQDLTITELFYHASLLHLKFVHIHPFWDGNGRTARLLEKWFLAAKINSRAWQIQSEKYYKENLKAYYKNINLGVNYYELDYTKCIDFLVMLGKSIRLIKL
ncbi:MAG: Fic family protein [Saprospiraceae bacterium]|nr:Fic family protein [Saprospiraceae bacterium]